MQQRRPKDCSLWPWNATKLKETSWLLCPSEACWSSVKGDQMFSPCELRDCYWATSSQWQSHLAPSSLGHHLPLWIQPVAHSHSLRLMDSISLPFSNPNHCRACQRFCPSAWAGCSEKPLPPATISHWFLITHSSGQLSSGSLQPDVWANYPQQPFPTALQWDTLGQAFARETLGMVMNIWSKLLLISSTNDLICFCFKSVQLTTFQISSFCPEIMIKT